MREDAASTKPQSLGELIAALRPGDPCPWCGAPLQRATTLMRVDGAGAGGSTGPPGDEAHDVIIACPECRSEVCLAGTAAGSRFRRSLGAAA